MEYPKNRTDVYHVAFLLRQKLVADLVPIILDEARYWTRRRVATNESTVVSDAPEGKRILRTAPLTAEEHRRVRLVKFGTRSVAQCFDRSMWDRAQSPSCGVSCGGSKSLQHGAAAEMGTPGSGSSSSSSSSSGKKDDAFTWFEAHAGNGAAPDHLYPDTSSRHPDAVRVGAPRSDDAAPWEGPRLIANCNSEEELCGYEAEWRFDAEDGAERALVRSIAKGDCIDLTAHCSVFGWENYVKHAEVEIFFGHVR